MMLKIRLVALALYTLPAITLVACKDNTAPPPPTVAGTWSGVINSTGQTLSMTVVQNGNVVSGNGTITHSSGPRALTVSGTFAHPTLNVTFNPGGTAQPFNLTGTFASTPSATSLQGPLQGSGFNGDQVTLFRQP